MKCSEVHQISLSNEHLKKNERKTLWVVILTAAMMGIEIAAGTLTGSMALLADGWHMASHAGALFISLLAYRLSRSERIQDSLSFGAGKSIPLGGYTSAVILAIIAVLMGMALTRRTIMIAHVTATSKISIMAIALMRAMPHMMMTMITGADSRAMGIMITIFAVLMCM